MASDRLNGFSTPEDGDAEKALTPIHRGIHCAATPTDETNRIQLQHFFNVLADVALSVASLFTCSLQTALLGGKIRSRNLGQYGAGDDVAAAPIDRPTLRHQNHDYCPPDSLWR